MSITFYTVDVGHGLCQVIRFGERAILIDGGGAVGKRVAEDFLKRYVRVIIAYIATHNDADHVAAAPELLDHYASAATLNTIWLLLDRPARARAQTDEDVIPLVSYSKQRERANTILRRHALYVDDTIAGPKVIHREHSENAELQLLYPRMLDTSASVIRGKPDAGATNQVSAILRLVVGEPRGKASVLITGDANCESFRITREVYRHDLGARVLSVPHHGGRIPMPAGSRDWNTVVDWVAPEIAVVSAGFGTVPATTTTRRGTFDPLRQGTVCCTQITEHCHPRYKDFAPGVRPLGDSPMPQMSGRQDYPDAVACAGTIVIKVNAQGEVKFSGRDQHRNAVDQKVAPAPGCPHCR